jgi:hypothetical protein
MLESAIGLTRVAKAARKRILEHFPEKWTPDFRRKCDRAKSWLERIPIDRTDYALAAT